MTQNALDVQIRNFMERKQAEFPELRNIDKSTVNERG
jgi:hypothetical protein